MGITVKKVKVSDVSECCSQLDHTSSQCGPLSDCLYLSSTVSMAQIGRFQRAGAAGGQMAVGYSLDGLTAAAMALDASLMAQSAASGSVCKRFTAAVSDPGVAAAM